MLVCSIGFFMVDLSLAELVGIVPFAGGSFGFVRCSLGPFWGFFTACTEMVVYMIYTVRTIEKAAQLVTIVTETSKSLEPAWALCAYLVITCLHLHGGSIFWKTMLGCTILTFLMLGAYIIGSLTVVDYSKYAVEDGHNNGEDGFRYMEYCYLPMWFYMGICALPLTGQRVKDAHIHIPHAIVGGLITMAIISILCIFCVACQYPGIALLVERGDFALQTGFQNAFDAPLEIVAFLLFVPTFASAIGFMFAAKHQIAAMADSGLMPEIFKRRFGVNQVPVYSVLFSAFLQYLIFLVIFYYLEFNIPATFRICCAAACLMYILVLAAFIAFRYKFTHMKRHFVSPVGVPGAVIGIIVFIQILIGLVFFQSGNRATWIAVVVFLTLMMIYYFAYVQYVQFFSKEEQDKFMKAYILNANKKRKASRWLKMMTACCVATGLDKIALRSRSSPRGTRSGANNSINSNVSINSNNKNGSIDSDDKNRNNSNTNASTVASVGHSHDKLPLTSMLSIRHNKVDIEPSETTTTAEMSASAVETDSKKKQSMKKGQQQKGLLRSSLTWSGKHFSGEDDSRKAFQLLHHQAHHVVEEEVGDEMCEDGPKRMSIIPVQSLNENEEAVVEDEVANILAEQFPDHFCLVEGSAENDAEHNLNASHLNHNLRTSRSSHTSSMQTAPLSRLMMHPHDLEMGVDDQSVLRSAEPTA